MGPKGEPDTKTMVDWQSAARRTPTPLHESRRIWNKDDCSDEDQQQFALKTVSGLPGLKRVGSKLLFCSERVTEQ
jgi:hypothetical protein